MTKRNCFILLVVTLCLSFSIAQSEKLFAGDKKLTPEDVIDKHLKSIGNPDALAKLESRQISGSASVIFLRGGSGQLEGMIQVVSEGFKLGMITKYDNPDYPGEHFAFNGDAAGASYLNFSNRSPLGEFINRSSGLIREGLLGGTLSVAWSMLNLPERKAKLKYKERKIDGRQLHELTYTPKSRRYLDNVTIKLYFDFETFRHVRSEYRLNESMSMASDQILDNYTLLLEEFDNFEDVEGLMLPHSYTMDLSNSRGSYHHRYTFEIKQWIQNKPVDPQLFEVQ